MPVLGHVGIAIGTSLSSWLNAALLWRGLARRGQFQLDARARRRLPRLLLAAVAMGAAVWLAGRWAQPWLVPTGPSGIPALTLLILLGTTLFGLLVVATGAARWQEMRRGFAASGGLTEAQPGR
jgi:putative peptidoglycan lipid II flippase